MTPGQFARRLLGRHFESVGKVYRRFFVDLDKVVAIFARELPHGARVLDIGGGDGALIDRLLDRRPDLKISLCDLSPSIGEFLSDANRARVKLLPATRFASASGTFDAITLSDVIHHIPVAQRDDFFRSLAGACPAWQCRKLVLKDIEPGAIRSGLSVLADRYITGDRHVVLFSRTDFAQMAAKYFPTAKRTSEMADWPNYCETLSW